MVERKFELGEYVEVKDRIKLFYELYAGGRLVTDTVEIVETSDGKSRVMVRARAYRDINDPLPGTGTSWMDLPGTTSFTRGSEVENAETSAWGRAIGSLGILIDRSIATSNEIENKADDRPAPRRDETRPELVRETHRDGLIGDAVTQGSQDYGLRETPTGHMLPFRIKEGRSTQIVVAEDALALALAPLRADVIGHRVTVWGHYSREELPKDGKVITFSVLHLTRIQTPEWTLPALSVVPAGSGDISDDEAAEILAREMAEAQS